MKNPLTIHEDASERLHYNVDSFPIYVCLDELSNYDYQALVHWHPDLEFIYIVKGTMDYYINGHTVRINQGDGIFVNSQRLHYGFSKEKNECTFIALVISPDLFSHMAFDMNIYFNKKFGLKNTDYIPLYRHVSWEKEILDYIKSIQQSSKQQTKRPLLLVVQALKIIDLIGEHIDDYQENNFNSDNQNIFLEMTTFIANNFQTKITIASLAKKVGISRNKCCQLFQQFTNDTLVNYLTKYRLNKSKEYLRNTHLTICQIALMCGFSSASYFTLTFKKEIGTTPKTYRQHQQKKIFH